MVAGMVAGLPWHGSWLLCVVAAAWLVRTWLRVLAAAAAAVLVAAAAVAAAAGCLHVAAEAADFLHAVALCALVLGLHACRGWRWYLCTAEPPPTLMSADREVASTTAQQLVALCAQNKQDRSRAGISLSSLLLS
eukprot:m.502013 g.502013  ORF g.502013 m.502013 type:complete len:135 (-) comp66229_c0_seq1:45-449(-)